MKAFISLSASLNFLLIHLTFFTNLIYNRFIFTYIYVNIVLITRQMELNVCLFDQYFLLCRFSHIFIIIVQYRDNYYYVILVYIFY